MSFPDIVGRIRVHKDAAVERQRDDLLLGLDGNDRVRLVAAPYGGRLMKGFGRAILVLQDDIDRSGKSADVLDPDLGTRTVLFDAVNGKVDG